MSVFVGLKLVKETWLPKRVPLAPMPTPEEAPPAQIQETKNVPQEQKQVQEAVKQEVKEEPQDPLENEVFTEVS